MSLHVSLPLSWTDNTLRRDLEQYKRMLYGGSFSGYYRCASCPTFVLMMRRFKMQMKKVFLSPLSEVWNGFEVVQERVFVCEPSGAGWVLGVHGNGWRAGAVISVNGVQEWPLTFTEKPWNREQSRHHFEHLDHVWSAVTLTCNTHRQDDMWSQREYGLWIHSKAYTILLLQLPNHAMTRKKYYFKLSFSL